MDQGVGHRVKGLREERNWSQAKLAVEADMSVSGVSMIENGQRNLTTTTLGKLARAFGVEVADLFPKAEEPLPFEEERRRLSNVPDALEAYMKARGEKHEQEMQDPGSLHFKTATAGALWVASVREEATMWSDWVAEWGLKIMPPTEGIFDMRYWADTLQVMGYVLAFHLLADKAERRIKRMADKPDELAQKRLDKATIAAEASQKRLDVLMAASG
jgi:transcriptional regulator with XRE-family HTH domain